MPLEASHGTPVDSEFVLGTLENARHPRFQQQIEFPKKIDKLIQ